ncbi:MAG: beta galactosidase jelly roll domain-containing protein [Bacteroidetes bacterium]|nr:beta galactosidase jelly roll domain-containing protein [Bacteroidota bacterium]
MLVIFSLLLQLVLLIGFGNHSPNLSLTVNKLFTDGAVLQRDAVIPIWGTASSSAIVMVILDDDEVSTQATTDGNWMTSLKPYPAGGPHTLMIISDSDTLTAENILFGDVWIASGQSNMEWSVAASADAESEISTANDPLLRHYKVPRSWSYSLVDTLAGGEWHSANPDHVGAFTAVGYSFARELRKHTGIPIGIVNTSWGGSRIEAWMDPDALEVTQEDLNQVFEASKEREVRLMRILSDEHGASTETDSGFESNQPIWADPDLDDSQWMNIPVPGAWEAAGLEGLNGAGWYRTTFELDFVPNGATLHLGHVDDEDMTWINGHFIGGTNEYQIQRSYAVEDGILQTGMNQVTIRVYDSWGNGGLVVGDSQLKLQWPEGELDLEGEWKFRVGQFDIEPDGNPNQLPTLLYNAMVHPILHFPITGFIWYQGEANGTNPEDASAYADQFQSLITTWRKRWNHDTAPFLFVSLASFQPAHDVPTESDWAILRESQAAALTLPNVGQAITLDIGDADDIHPKNKQDVGDRLSLWARHLVYQEDLIFSGPLYSDHAIEMGEVHIQFDHVGGGLIAHGDSLGGFAIAGEDGQFVWAHARIQDETVIVSHPDIPNPTSVRYAWADNPSSANLMNIEGLPAAPFRIGN